MALRDWFTSKTLPNIGYAKAVKEQFKGETTLQEAKIPGFEKEIGIEHPFDFSIPEGLYKKFGLVLGVVDKYVDFVIGPGFHLKEDLTTEGAKRARDILERFMQDVNLDTVLREWLREALIKGNGFLELGGKADEPPQGLKVLDAKSMFVKRDKKGEVLSYTQLIGGDVRRVTKSKTISFTPEQIAHLALNKVSGEAYGCGIIIPAMTTINSLLGVEKDLALIMQRKANSPIHVQIGTDEAPATQTDIDNFAKELEFLRNTHEWATDHRIKMNVLDFGKVGEKFETALDHYFSMLIYTFQVPEVLMGKGNIPEGLAAVQMDAFERRVQSIQAEMEKIIEQHVFKRVLAGNGIGDLHVEFEWGQPSNAEVKERIATITELLKLFTLSPSLRTALEEELVKLFDFKIEIDPEAANELKKEEPQPGVPGANRQPQKVNENLNKDYALREWLNFDFRQYLKNILAVVGGDEFEQLVADNPNDLAAGYLSREQVNELRQVMKDGFRNDQSLRQISEQIKSKVKPKDLYQTSEDGEVIRDKNGIALLKLSADARPAVIARSETTRLAAQGSLNYFKDEGFTKYEWIASWGDRVCPVCSSLDGNVFEIGKGPLPGEPHPNCVCTITTFTEPNQ